VSEFPCLLRLNNVLLYAFTTFCLSVHLLPPPFVEAVVNSATMNVGVQMSL
jgi:hypothetical protein